MSLTRRRALIVGGGVVGAAAAGLGIGYGPRVLDRLTRDCGVPGPLPPQSEWEVRPGTLRSRFVAGRVGYAIAEPPDGRPATVRRPVVICLPGRGSTGAGWLASLRLHDFAADAVARGAQPFALAALDGGESYWHTRASGEDRLAMLVREFVPLLAERGLGVGPDDRTLAGWSMGGYGALLATIRSPHLFAGTSVVSPALWTSPADTADGAFDDAEDYRRNDVFSRASELHDRAVRLECGTGDPFIDAARAFAGRLSDRQSVSFAPGCHDGAYWRRVAPEQLAWLTG